MSSSLICPQRQQQQHPQQQQQQQQREQQRRSHARLPQPALDVLLTDLPAATAAAAAAATAAAAAAVINDMHVCLNVSLARTYKAAAAAVTAGTGNNRFVM
jgi:transcription initiation factor TFIID subunit TAF12